MQLFRNRDLIGDSEEARWVAEGLEPHWGRGDGCNYVAAVVPRGFAAYAKVFHPAFSVAEGREVSWREVSLRSGRTPHALMQWERITVGLHPAEARRLLPPAVGHLPASVAARLVAVLRAWTSTPAECRFAVWEGWGGLEAEASSAGAARFSASGRSYLLFEGPIEAATRSAVSVHPQSASLWWPRDRAWCVATEIDLMWTLVGGSAACIEELLSVSDLEVYPAHPDDRIDAGSDTVNA